MPDVRIQHLQLMVFLYAKNNNGLFIRAPTLVPILFLRDTLTPSASTPILNDTRYV